MVIQRDTCAQRFWSGVTETQSQLLILTWDYGEGIAERGANHDGVKFVVPIGASFPDFEEHVEFCGAGHDHGVAACADSATADSGGWCGLRAFGAFRGLIWHVAFRLSDCPD